MNNQLKIILILICIGVIFVLFSIFSMLYNYSSDVNLMKNQNKKLIEHAQKIHELPNLKCKIVADSIHTSILAKKPSSFSLLRIGKNIWGTNNSNWGVKGKSGSSNTERKISQGIDWDYNSVVYFPPNTKLSINGKLYEIEFETVILSSKIGRVLEEKIGMLDTTLMLEKTAMYVPQELKSFQNKHIWINNFYTPSKRVEDLTIAEVNFQNGDSIAIKGEIIDNKIHVYQEYKFSNL